MATAKQRAWRRKFTALAKSGKWRKRKRRAYGAARLKRQRKAKRVRGSVMKRLSRKRSRVRTMARRRRSRRSGLGSAKGLASKLVLGMGVATLIPGMAGTLGAYVLGGPMAAVGNFAAPMIRSAVGGVAGGSSNGGQVW